MKSIHLLHIQQLMKKSITSSYALATQQNTKRAMRYIFGMTVWKWVLGLKPPTIRNTKEQEENLNYGHKQVKIHRPLGSTIS